MNEVNEVLEAMKASEQFQFFAELHELVHVEGLKFATVMAPEAGRIYFGCGLDLLYKSDGHYIQFLSLSAIEKNFLLRKRTITFHRGDIAAGGRDHLSCASSYGVIEDTNWSLVLEVDGNLYRADPEDLPCEQGTAVHLVEVQ